MLDRAANVRIVHREGLDVERTVGSGIGAPAAVAGRLIARRFLEDRHGLALSQPKV
jgi:hypothetical protein